MSGPIILDMSRNIGIALEKDALELSIDWKPALDYPELDKRVQKDFQEFSNKSFKNSLDLLLPKKAIPVFINLLKINPDKKVNLITSVERKQIIKLLKDFRLNILNLEKIDMAIVTAGGVPIQEIDPRTMKSKIIKNLYFAGEIIDLDGPTGGYNLQMCWSTGYFAGNDAII